MTKITQLPLAGPITRAETVPIVQSGQTRRVNLGDMFAPVDEAVGFAEELINPAYDNVGAGELATPVGHFFRVWNGDTPRTYTRYQRTASGSELASPLASTAALYAPGGALLVRFQQSGAGAVPRTVEDKLRDTVSLKDFGAVGTVIADDTVAFEAAKIYMAATGNPVLIPPGTYMTDPFSLDPSAYNAQGFFFGLEAASTIIKRRTAGAGAFVTVGSPAGVVFQANLVFSGLTIDGGATTNGPACVMYDVVRSRCDGVIFNGGSRALLSYGGIANTFNHCNFQGAQRGLMIDGFAPSGGLSPAGGGWPNILRFNNCHMVDNSEWGVWFDHGRALILNDCQVEGNGTTLGADEGGIYIGPNVGQEVAITDTSSIGLIMRGGWCEGNRGVADIHLNSGINKIADVNFFSQSTMVNNDIKISGGRYRLYDLNMSFGKTANVLEEAGVSSGNCIFFVEAAALTYNSGKTMLFGGSFGFLGNGAMPGVNGMTAPLIQTGTDSSGGNPTISFPVAFKLATSPLIQTSIVNNSPATIDQVETYGISRTGFTMRKKSYNGSAIGTSNYTVQWWAIGENP